MEKIANDIVSKAISDFSKNLEQIIIEAQKEAYRQAINDFMEVMHYDIESCVTIGFEGCGDIFHDSKTQQFISDKIIQELKNRLNQKNFGLQF